jgi:hypothetical protein
MLMVLAGVVPVVVAVLLSAHATSASVKASVGRVRLVTPAGTRLPGRWQSFANASLMPTVRGGVVVLRRRCPALPFAAGCVYTRHPRRIYVRPGVDDPRGVLLHELGHVYDLTVLNNRDRGRFRAIVHAKRRKWWRGSPPLAEQFAEAYSWCARYKRIVSIARYASYHYDPSPKQHRAICTLIRRAAHDRKGSAPAAHTPVVTAPHAPPPPPPSTAPGVVPGDPAHDPGPQHPEDPNKKPTPTPTPTPGLPLPVPTPHPSSTPSATPTIPPLPGLGG